MRIARRRFSYMGETPAGPTGTAGPLPNPNAPQVQYVQDWFVNTINFLNIAAGGTSLGNLQIDADSDFELVKLSAQVNEHANDSLLDLNAVQATLMITDSGSGRNLMNIPTPIPAIFGTGQLPYILPQPRIFKARTNIAFTLVNASAGTTYDLRLALSGRKIFAQGIP